MIIRTLLPYALVAAVVGGGVFWIQGMRWDLDVAAIKDAHATASTAAQNRADRNADTLNRRIDELNEKDAEREKTLAADLAERDATAVSLRDQISKLRQRPARVAAPDGSCPVSGTERVLLAEVFPEADDFAQGVAAEADRLRIALDSCVAQYNAARESTRSAAPDQ